MRLIDLTGRRFGRLVVQYRSPNNDHHFAVWVCHCDCGRLAFVRSQRLRTGETRSCGCLSAELTRQRIREGLQLPGGTRPDLTGQTFGRLTVLRRSRKKHRSHGQWWICRCRCGRQREVLTSDLRAGRTVSCGKC